MWYPAVHTPPSDVRTQQTLDAKKEWNEHFEAYIRDLDNKKAVIWSGDLNVAPTALGEYFPHPHRYSILHTFDSHMGVVDHCRRPLPVFCIAVRQRKFLNLQT